MTLVQNHQRLLNGNKFLILSIKQKHIYAIVFAFFMIFSWNAAAQSDSLEVHTIKGKQYYIHIVAPGETLYSIHKKYRIPQDVIKKENPGVLDGLSIDEKVFIPLKRDEVVEVEADGNYLMHTVEKKQTLYSIARIYKVKEKEIKAANPELDNGLKEDQIIRIPIVNLKKESDVKDKKGSNKSIYKTHVVAQGETLYKLSKLYNTTVDSIKMVNSGLPQGLRKGETIYVPVLLVEQEQVINENEVLEPAYKDSVIALIEGALIKKKAVYSIGLLLPFFLNENSEMVENRSALERKKIYPKSKFAVEFYNGFMHALDSMYGDSCKFQVYAYDTKGKDSTNVMRLLQKPLFKELDLIVGPLYYTNFKMAAAFAKENQIPIVSPVKQSNKVLLGNEYVFKIIPSKTSILEPISKLVVDSFKTENLLAISFEKAKEKSLVELLIAEYNQKLLALTDTTSYTSFKTIAVKYNYGDIITQLSPVKNNILFMPTTNQATVTSVFSQLISMLNKKNYKDYRITIIGLEEWMKFENIELDYFQRLNVHYCSSQYINSDDSLTTNFIEKYVQLKEVYPSKTALLGFDLGYYFSTHFRNFGTNFNANYLMPYIGKSIQLNFYKTGIESGYDNTHTSMLRFYDYEIDKIE